MRRSERGNEMKKERIMERVDTGETEYAWLEYWRWWNSDRPAARLELKVKPQPCHSMLISLTLSSSLKTLLRKRLTRLLGTLEHKPKISH